ncbi:4-hydroxy-tetrahydrodipicolinate synthase [Paramagnetospirillum magnetotacticum MS-1]|uniref:4-hydroxy-tetrahydrodipicolinate synthase n=1 Tax=Paramagnetospirillum magnetotacticum MS-1 TaxID=272627 RepID=A0A0C2YW80_PARME|nr:4-hydroxy-tetrahydrodipicolinate synthase [Paramagnetospirillum magnetotacticum]KIL98955.1 4-hydroxy-tetrahydrodipicolinate synthase [Paramagnetospirillum magnetotacticum MS-1]
MFKGSITALITPFRNGSVDEKAFQDLAAWQIAEGTHALVPCGTTGESPTLSHDEHHRVVELCIEVARGKVPVIAGTGSNSTDEAVALTRHAKKAGADAALVVAPYYNKPSQEGLFRHFEAIATSVDIPIIVYNIPGRSVIDISVETFVRLSALPNIAGIKDATADLARPLRIRAALGERLCQLSGEDATAIAFNAQGGVGCISVTSNIAPKLCSQMQNAWAARDFATCDALNKKLMPLHDALFCETSPAPVKYAASLLGKSTPDVRLPLVPASENARHRVEAAMKAAGLI